MRSMVLHRFGGPENMAMVEAPEPTPRAGEVLVRVRACGVCYHDLIARRGSLGGEVPMTLGHEIVGEVLALGPGVTGFAVGDRVATLQRMSCGACKHCLADRASLCKVDRRFFGEEIPGGYATHMVAPAHGLCPVPAALSWDEAATICCTTGTAIHVCRTQGRVKDGETVLVTGASGGVGQKAVQLCRLAGAKVIAVTTSRAKAATLEALGADHVVVAPDLEFAGAVKKITRGEGVDVALEIVGSASFGATLKSLAPGGRAVVVGNLDTRTFDLNPGLVIVKELQILGAYATSKDELRQAFELTAKGHVKSCVSEVHPLDEAARVHARLERREIAGRAVLVPPGA